MKSINKSNRNLLINSLIMVALYLIVSSIPVKEPLTPTGLKTLAIVVAAIYGWCTIDMVVPSIAAVIAYGLITDIGVAGAVMSGSGSFLLMMILATLLISGIMVHTGLARTIALKITNSKIASGRPWVLTLLLLIAAAVPSMFLPGLVVVLVVWDIAYSIFEVSGFKKGDSWPSCIMIAICASATSGMMCSHISTGVIPNVAIIKAIDPSLALNPLAYTGSSIIMLILFTVACMLILKYIFKPDLSLLKNYKAPEEEIKFTLDQKRAMVIMIAFVILVTVPDLLPASAFAAFLSKFTLIGWGFLLVGIALLIRNKDGSPFITIKQITDSGVYWEMLLMLGSIQVVCGSLGNPEFGISEWMIQLISPLLTNFGNFGVVAILMLLSLIITNLLDSAVTTFVFTYVVYTICSSLGMNIMGVFSILLHLSGFGMLLPASSPPLTLMYGKVQDGWVNSKSILRSAWPYVLVEYIIVLGVGWVTMGWF